MEIECPDKFIRGIFNDTYISDDGCPLEHLYHFEEKVGKDANGNDREDSYAESSITWYDCEEAIDIVLKQEKKGKPQFKYGVAITDREVIDNIKKLVRFRAIFSYERKEIDENKYHGNLLIKYPFDKKIMGMIAAIIAGNTTDIRKRE